MSKDSIQTYTEGVREEFKKLLKSKQGSTEVKKIVEEAEDFFQHIQEVEPWQQRAYIALKEVKENRKIYFEHYDAIIQFVEVQRKLEETPTDSDYIIF